MIKDWKSFAELLGITAIVASLIFLGLQLKQSQATAISEMAASQVASLIEENNAVIGNMDIWIRGNSDENLSPADAEIYARLVTNMNNRFYFIVQQQIHLGLGDNVLLDVAEFASYLYENPRAKRVWRAREERLGKYRGMIRSSETVTSDWITLVESNIAVFERQSATAVQ